MLVIFRSKAAGDIIMFKENAKQILDLFNRETKQGIIMAEEMAWAIEILEKEITLKKIEEAQEKAAREEQERIDEEKKEKFGDEDNKKNPPREKIIPIPFSARAFPFMQMLKAAHKKKQDIVWGV